MKRKKGKTHVQPLTRSIGILQNGTLWSAQLREVLDGNETADNSENGRGTIPPPFQRYLILIGSAILAKLTVFVIHCSACLTFPLVSCIRNFPLVGCARNPWCWWLLLFSRFRFWFFFFNQFQSEQHIKNAVHILEQQAYTPCQPAIYGIGA